MRRAGYHQSVAISSTPDAPSGDSVQTFPVGSRATAAMPPLDDSSAPDVLLSPAGTFVSPGGIAVDHEAERRRQLAIAIRQRIETRLAGRIRDLAVRIVGQRVVLEGNCATYYSKQLAQHAALGVLEDEQLDNAIVVAVPA